MRQWTEEDRKRQSELIKAHKPWKRSTGPKTEEGKAVSSLNALKHSLRSASATDLAKAFSEYRKVKREIISRFMLKYAIQRHENKMADERTDISLSPEWNWISARTANFKGEVGYDG